MWSRDGKELFFVPAPGRFMAVTVRTTAPSFTVTNPVAVPRGFGVAHPAEPANIRHHAGRPFRRRCGPARAKADPARHRFTSC